MNGERSEALFEAYLREHSLRYERHVCVSGKKNVDFRVTTTSGVVFCDVKEVRDSRAGTSIHIDSYSHIREDLKDLRKKFGKSKPSDPVVLVTMNFSTNFFTAHTVVRAMYGDVGAAFTSTSRGPLHHMPRANASMSKSSHTAISGVFVFDCAAKNHTYLENEFATIKLPPGYFPEVREVHPTRAADEGELIRLAHLMFWECHGQEAP
jgi:hypothetical protein